MQSRPDENMEQTFESLYEVIRSKDFLERRGIGNEVPFFISAFHPSLQSDIDDLVPSLTTRLCNGGLPVLHLDLYDLAVELLEFRNRWKALLEKEPNEPKDRFLKTMQNVTDARDHLVPLIDSKIKSSACRVLFITGVGLVFPYLRSHNVLENLQRVTKLISTVLFFPGDYTFVEGKGSYLKLFGTLPDDRYYRAFNIADFRK